MGNQEPVALWLAERLERRRLTRWVHATGETPRASGYVVDQDCAEAAAELRRLHDLNGELLEALKLAVRQNEHDMLMTGEELRNARAAIARAEGEKT
jgi:hypothetical protein